MEAVAKALDVTKPVVYACFASREALLDALLAREEERLLADVMGALPQQLDPSDPDAMFREGFTALLRVVATRPRTWQFVLAEADASVGERYGKARARVAARVEELMRLGLARRGAEHIERKLPVLVALFMSAGDVAVRAMGDKRATWTAEELGPLIGRVVLAALRAA
jgi:AcrR family transcriptional regulator